MSGFEISGRHVANGDKYSSLATLRSFLFAKLASYKRSRSTVSASNVRAHA